MAKHVTLLFKALLPRFLFVGHGGFCMWMVVALTGEKLYWILSVCLGLIVVEGFYNVFRRKGKEFDWFCPSAFFYCVVIITVLFAFRMKSTDCIISANCNKAKPFLSDIVSEKFGKLAVKQQASILEQTAVLVLIIGRWTLPKGSISRDQFSQILLIYVAMAADIVEFSEIYSDDKIQTLSNTYQERIYRGTMAVWSWSIVQFAFTIALPEEGLKGEDKEEDENNNEQNVKWRQTNRIQPMSYMHYKSLLKEGWDSGSGNKGNRAMHYSVEWRGKYDVGKVTSNGKGRHKNTPPGIRMRESSSRPIQIEDADPDDTKLGIRKKEVLTCITKHMELINCLIPVVMQDGPFFIFRFILIVHYNVLGEMMILLTVKNALVIIVQIYRILILYCVEPKEEEPDIEDPSVRVRTAMNANRYFSEGGYGRKRASIVIQAISRMQSQVNLHKSAKETNYSSSGNHITM